MYPNEDESIRLENEWHAEQLRWHLGEGNAEETAALVQPGSELRVSHLAARPGAIEELSAAIKRAGHAVDYDADEQILHVEDPRAAERPGNITRTLDVLAAVAAGVGAAAIAAAVLR